MFAHFRLAFQISIVVAAAVIIIDAAAAAAAAAVADVIGMADSGISTLFRFSVPPHESCHENIQTGQRLCYYMFATPTSVASARTQVCHTFDIN